MDDPSGIAAQTQENLRQLLGQRLLGSRNFCETRHFYFGEPSLAAGLREPCYTLGLECPWRIQTAERIIVGSEDYYQRADDNTDPLWEPGAESGHLQDQGLAEWLGELKDGDVINTGPGLIVNSVEADRYGGFQIRLTGGYSIAVVPCSRDQMEWIFMLPGGGSLMLIDGAPTRSGSSRPPSPPTMPTAT